ncbi:alpha/beta hydrolase [Caulobacter sp. 3R27C2-B]|uniref:alpha/beta fold hydrolase n=1 Tax=Caulobacter sp. 3R27C2-B TaxID=2502219 RepID=UPI0032C48454
MTNALSTEMPPPRFAELNGIRLCWYEVGSPDEERAVPVIFCHGFPELAFSWRHQLRALGSAGIWALAPDQRGYGLSSAPEDVLAYGMEELCGDLITLLDHIGADRAIWCGHDWGGLIVWHMALRHPDRTAGIIALNTPFMPRLPADPIQMLRASRGEDNYIVQFQRPGEADAVLNAHPREAFSLMMQRPDPNGARGVRPNKSLIQQIATYAPEDASGEKFLTPEAFEVFVETFARTGFTGGINWYRNFSRNWLEAEKLPLRVDGLPCLMLTAELDPILPPSAASQMPSLVGDLEMAMVKGSGHWTQQERPDEVNRLILDWLGRRFSFSKAKG